MREKRYSNVDGMSQEVQDIRNKNYEDRQNSARRKTLLSAEMDTEEDKMEKGGKFVEISLKPDWETEEEGKNYICRKIDEQQKEVMEIVTTKLEHDEDIHLCNRD